MGLIVGGLLFFLIGFFLYWREYHFFKKAIIVNGVVVDICSKQERDNKRGRTSTLYSPVVQVEFDGKTLRVEGDFFSNVKPTLGKVMQVGINPLRPNDIRLKQKGAFFLAGIFMALGALITFLGLGSF